MPSSAMPMVSMQILFRLIIRQREPNNLSRAAYRGKKLNIITLQEMCCGFLLSREMWYRKSVLPGTGAG